MRLNLLRFNITILIAVLFLASCKNKVDIDEVPRYYVLNGETMGTYYRIVVATTDTMGIKASIDDLLIKINAEVSTYEGDSYITEINKSPKGAVFSNLPRHFKYNLEKAYWWYDHSDGYMDVSIGPLVNYWGFGTRKKSIDLVDSVHVEQLKLLVGLEKWSFNIGDGILTKNRDEQYLDFSALAKGYAVDEIGDLLRGKGIQDFLIDIGGEGRANGTNPKEKDWVIGISVPRSDAEMSEYQLLVQLKNKALATSGNYRNYYEVKGGKYGHTIDPKSGYPFQDELLSTTIICDNAIDADAIATSCMAMGYAKATTFINSLPNVSACFLVGSEDGSIKTKFENGFVQYIVRE